MREYSYIYKEYIPKNKWKKAKKSFGVFKRWQYGINASILLEVNLMFIEDTNIKQTILS